MHLPDCYVSAGRRESGKTVTHGTNLFSYHLGPSTRRIFLQSCRWNLPILALLAYAIHNHNLFGQQSDDQARMRQVR